MKRTPFNTNTAMRFALIFGLLLCISLSSFGQTDSAPPDDISITETERIVDKYSGKIADNVGGVADALIEGFNAGIEKITPIAESGFDAMVTFNIAKGIVYLSPTFILLIIIIIGAKSKLMGEDITGDNVPTASGIVIGILFITFLALASSYFYDGVLHLVAPEYYAILDILDLIK